MSPVTNVWRQLVQRRLWPVAILLIAALAAVPMMLAKDPEPTASPPATPADTKGELAATPIVAPATDTGKANRRKVLGAAKNPFGVAKQAQAGSDAAPNTDSVVQKTPAGGSSLDDAGTGGGSTASGGSAPVAPVAPATPAEPAPAPKEYEPEELTVRFGDGTDMKRRSVKKLQPLPSAELPAVVYMGMLKDGKTAVFLLEAGVTPDGDGECRPTPEQCETIRLRIGETEFFDVAAESGAAQQFQLDLLKVHNLKKHASASRAKSARLKSGARGTAARASVSRRVAAYLP
jgi:hypothetical protein